MEMFREVNYDEIPDADDPAKKHDLSDKANHRYNPCLTCCNPEVTKRVCVSMCSFQSEVLPYMLGFIFLNVLHVSTATSCQMHGKLNAHSYDCSSCE